MNSINSYSIANYHVEFYGGTADFIKRMAEEEKARDYRCCRSISDFCEYARRYYPGQDWQKLGKELFDASNYAPYH